MTAYSQQQGFTLIELMTTLAVLSLTLAIGVPAFKNTVARNDLRAETNRLISSINFARSQAVGKRQVVTLSRLGATAQDWSDGWNVFTDSGGEGNQTFDAGGGDVLLKNFSVNSTHLEIHSNAAASQVISFNTGGRIILNGGNIQFAICSADVTNSSSGRLVEINSVGRTTVTTIPTVSAALCLR